MAHKLGLKVIAEGVETHSQLAILKQAECDYAQGYFISKPIKPCEFERALRAKDPFEMNQKCEVKLTKTGS